ncbi:AIPR family protein [Nocardia salmonicida]|uniref:AIPR family protein n=1 Tax=Nocardia salmonicida TaxID=53431 RepID=UPI00363E95CA
MSNERSGRGTPLEVQHIRDALKREFATRISMTDYEGRQPHERENAFLSRALSAKAARMLTDCTSDEAAVGVIDGRNDFGIDAVAFSASGAAMWLIQAKWSDKGQAGFDTAAAHKLIHGLKKLDNREFDRFNARLQLLADRVRSVFAIPTCKIYLVVAVLGEGRLSEETESILREAAVEFGGYGRSIQHRVLNQAEFHQAVRDDLAPEPIDITATMTEGWHSRDTPYLAYDGLVCAQELATWYGAHGERLYDRNVRRSLGLTDVNQTLVASLIDDPQGFWYRHNGITVQCDTIDPDFFAQRGPSKPVRLTLRNASVVNGAQTVTSSHRAYEQNPKALADAFVTVRIISVADASERFAKEITKATNTQNRMERRDFIAIDDVQARIREDLRLTLDKDYVLRRGEIDPPPAFGCSVYEAAVALACAHQDSALAAKINGTPDAVWEDGPDGAYPRLFGQQPNAQTIWRSVLLMREVRDQLHRTRSRLFGRAASIADSGALLIAHMVFQLVGADRMNGPDVEWDSTLDAISDYVDSALRELIPLVNKLFGDGSYVTTTFTNRDRCEQLVSATLRAIEDGTDTPDLTYYEKSDAWRSTSRPNVVSLIFNADGIAPGTELKYLPGKTETQAISDWLHADRDRPTATWVKGRSKPLRWAVDGKDYTPTGLIREIWRQAGWDEAPVTVRGPKYWVVPSEGTLIEIADRIWQRYNENETL